VDHVEGARYPGPPKTAAQDAADYYTPGGSGFELTEARGVTLTDCSAATGPARPFTVTELAEMLDWPADRTGRPKR
jgi:hypothetical protein